MRDECLNAHWLTKLTQAKVIIETWRRQYNEERPKKALGGLTPAAYAGLLAQKPNTLTILDSKTLRYCTWGNVGGITFNVLLRHPPPTWADLLDVTDGMATTAIRMSWQSASTAFSKGNFCLIGR